MKEVGSGDQDSQGGQGTFSLGPDLPHHMLGEVISPLCASVSLFAKGWSRTAIFNQRATEFLKQALPDF